MIVVIAAHEVDGERRYLMGESTSFVTEDALLKVLRKAGMNPEITGTGIAYTEGDVVTEEALMEALWKVAMNPEVTDTGMLFPPVFPTWDRWLSMDHFRANVARARTNRAARQKLKHFKLVSDRLRVI